MKRTSTLVGTALRYLVAPLCLTISGAAHAVLLDFATITQDTDTSLEWLDLSESLNRSFNDVSAEFGPGGDFEGFRYATELDLFQFWTNAGIPTITITAGGATALNFAPISALQALVGITQVTGAGTENTFGTQATVVAPGFHFVARLAVAPALGLGQADLRHSLVSTDSSGSPVSGNWLVRDAILSPSVPEPTSGVLVGLALAAMALRRRRESSSGAGHG